MIWGVGLFGDKGLGLGILESVEVLVLVEAFSGHGLQIPGAQSR